MVGFFGGEDKGSGFLYLSMAIIVAFIASALITFFNVKERIKNKKVSTEKFSFKDVKDIISKNDQLKSLIGVVLAFNIAIQLVGGFAIYYFSYAIGREDLFPMFALVSGMAEIAGVFLFPKLCNIINRKFMWLVACAFPLLCSLILALTGLFAPENGILVGIAGAALKFGGGLSNGLSTVMLADVVDYGEYKTGHRSESIIFSIQTMLVKFAGALSGFFVGIGLTAIGYVPNVEQSDETILGLRALMIGIPTLLVLLSAYIYKRSYRLNGDYQNMVLKEISST